MNSSNGFSFLQLQFRQPELRVYSLKNNFFIPMHQGDRCSIFFDRCLVDL
jgi:hypothetical protein